MKAQKAPGASQLLAARQEFGVEINDLVYADEHGLLGSNYYWNHRGDLGILSDADLARVGLHGPRVQCHHSILQSLLRADEELGKNGLQLYLKDGYRSPQLYELIYRCSVKERGRALSDRLFNMADMPHATGKAVDVVLWHREEDRQIGMRDPADGVDAFFVDFYKSRLDSQSQKFHRRQCRLIEVMVRQGFCLGTKREYFHFQFGV